jgi:hypothetical protein
MPTTKTISAPYILTGSTIYCIIRRDTDGFFLNDADGAFAAAPADPYISMTEHASMKGLYELSEARSAWNDGLYTVVAYVQTGVGPAPASDYVISLGQMAIADDAEITNATIFSEITGAVGSIWDELLSAHTDAGSMGKFMNTANTNFGLAV